MNSCIGTSDIQAIIEPAERLLAEEVLAEGVLSEQVEMAIQKLLNVSQTLSADKKSLADELERLRKEVEQKKKTKMTRSGGKEDDSDNRDGSRITLVKNTTWEDEAASSQTSVYTTGTEFLNATISAGRFALKWPWS